MKVLVLNGSPRGKRSNTMQLTHAFIDGLNQVQENEVEIIDLTKAEIGDCLGCFNCWTKTPGKCVLRDDMDLYLPKVIAADLIIWSFPLYYYSMPSRIKAFMDRTLPTVLPYMTVNEEGHGGHPSRYDFSQQRYFLISTCGFFNVEGSYDALVEQFDTLYGERYEKILCGEGELFRQGPLQGRTGEYLGYVKQAGAEYAQNGKVTETTQKHLAERLFPAEQFVKMADASWEINEDSSASPSPTDIADRFMQQMAAVYSGAGWEGEDIFIDMHFTDLDKTYQLCLGETECTVRSENLVPYTTRIETPYETWMDISEGRLDGAAAMMQQKYRVLGEFDTMMKMGTYFSTGSGETHKEEFKPVIETKKKPVNMWFLLLPWILLWALLPIKPIIGGAAGILASTALLLFSERNTLTIYDKIGGFLAAGIGVLALIGVVDSVILICGSYAIYGVLWLVSNLFPIPITAYYSSKDYGNEEAFANPLFIKTNRILSVMWGIVFLLTAVLAYFLYNSPMSSYTGLASTATSGLMGIFTGWFSKWYPAKVARG